MAKRMFTESEKQAIKNDYENMSLRNLAKLHNSNVDAVRVVLENMGVAVRGRGRPCLTRPTGGEVRLVEDEQDLFDPDNDLVTEEEEPADKDFDSWN